MNSIMVDTFYKLVTQEANTVKEILSNEARMSLIDSTINYINGTIEPHEIGNVDLNFANRNIYHAISFNMVKHEAAVGIMTPRMLNRYLAWVGHQFKLDNVKPMCISGTSRYVAVWSDEELEKMNELEETLDIVSIFGISPEDEMEVRRFNDFDDLELTTYYNPSDTTVLEAFMEYHDKDGLIAFNQLLHEKTEINIKELLPV